MVFWLFDHKWWFVMQMLVSDWFILSFVFFCSAAYSQYRIYKYIEIKKDTLQVFIRIFLLPEADLNAAI